MSYTTDATATNGSWSGHGQPRLVQLKTPGPVLVQVDSVQPDDASVVGVLLVKGGAEEVAMPEYDSGDIVWLRSLQDEDNTLALVMAGSQ